jgi:NAD/NADP transhydrogenase alpha subunit
VQIEEEGEGSGGYAKEMSPEVKQLALNLNVAMWTHTTPRPLPQ